MYPHPPNSSKVKSSSSSVRYHHKFPGKGDSLKSPIKSLPVVKMDDLPQSSRSARSSRKSHIDSNNLPQMKTQHLKQVKKKDSFSKFHPLPAIQTQHRQKTTKVNSNKRALPKHNTSLTNNSSEKVEDDILDTIKKMKLGSDFLSLESSTTKDVASRNCFELGVTSNCENEDQTSSSYLNENYHVNLMIRLPKGNRVEHCFSSKDTLEDVIGFLSKQMKSSINLKKYVLYTNEVPKKELKNRKSVLHKLGIKDRTVLVLDTRDG